MTGTPTAQPSGPGFLHRELLILLVLAGVAMLAFLGTRAIAAGNAAIRRSDAAAWHQRGRDALARGDTAGALAALRRAAGIERDDRDVAVSLAQALRAAGHDTEAAAVLERLRTANPDDAQVNIELARLETDAGALPLAIRYYQDALDALWTPQSAATSREVRVEFIELLLRHGERARALSQTLAMAADLPPDPTWQMTAARLFLAVGDARRALDRYGAVLKADPQNHAALAGAGQASFALGDYAQARRYLSLAGPLDPPVASLKRVADLVETADPLAVRLSRTERERRLQALLEHATARLDRCMPVGAAADPQRQALEDSLGALRAPEAPARGGPPPDERERIEQGVELALQVEHATAACGPQDELGQAVAIIARTRGIEDVR